MFQFFCMWIPHSFVVCSCFFVHVAWWKFVRFSVVCGWLFPYLGGGALCLNGLLVLAIAPCVLCVARLRVHASVHACLVSVFSGQLAIARPGLPFIAFASSRSAQRCRLYTRSRQLYNCRCCGVRFGLVPIYSGVDIIAGRWRKAPRMFLRLPGESFCNPPRSECSHLPTICRVNWMRAVFCYATTPVFGASLAVGN